MRDKNPSKKILQHYNIEKERKTGKTYYNEMSNKKRKNWDFFERRVEKKKKKCKGAST